MRRDADADTDIQSPSSSPTKKKSGHSVVTLSDIQDLAETLGLVELVDTDDDES